MLGWFGLLTGVPWPRRDLGKAAMWREGTGSTTGSEVGADRSLRGLGVGGLLRVEGEARSCQVSLVDVVPGHQYGRVKS